MTCPLSGVASALMVARATLASFKSLLVHWSCACCTVSLRYNTKHTKHKTHNTQQHNTRNTNYKNTTHTTSLFTFTCTWTYMYIFICICIYVYSTFALALALHLRLRLLLHLHLHLNLHYATRPDPTHVPFHTPLHPTLQYSRCHSRDGFVCILSVIATRVPTQLTSQQ